ncbi:NAD(P)/FAD-dependent oxidoreductase [Amycolatopsis sp. RTGN1]|uniref:NAD(P)/FAD-dependent oxidoreductase n=1 Tax=Amycolatopsis ponsaeliensis TaxID=2992142 RepID=UPI00254FEC58|nr:FAD-dependent oxidoreductase [Amycolatopsis sp. RTGN1]
MTVGTSGPRSVLVVGASAAGLSTVDTLRRRGYAGEITVLGAETHLPYDRPPLSKQVLSGVWEPDRTWLRPPAALAALGAEIILGDEAISLDAASRTVETAAGRELSADAVVVATGVRPRAMPGQAGLARVHVLRTLEDSASLRRDLVQASRFVVVGEGVLGAEIAATARGMGLDVTMVGPQPTPLTAQVGPLVGDLLTSLHFEHGVKLRLGTGVSGFTGEHGRVTGVRLDTGEVLPADVAVVAIGAAPVTGWLLGSGLDVDNGLVCDSRCRAAEGIYAAGDVARWHHEQLGGLVRLENRTNAIEQAMVVAGNIMGDDRPYTPVPYFWTDQYDVKVQVHGFPDGNAEVTVVEGDTAERRFVAQYRRDGRVTAVLGWNMPKQTRLRRQDVVDALLDPVSSEP